MEKQSTIIVTSNFNSLNNMALSKLSLYSIFNAIETIGAKDKIGLLMIDNASTDGSDAILYNFANKLSQEKEISFDFVKLKRDLGNSFAYAYGHLLGKKRGAKYIILMDNDYVILYPKVLDELIKIADKLSNINFYSIAPLSISGDRRKILNFINNFSSENPNSEIIEHLRNYIENNSSNYYMREISRIDDLGRIIVFPERLTLQEFLKFTPNKRIASTAYTPSFFSLYKSNLAPVFPYLYIVGDDIISGLEHTKRGYFCIILMNVLGGHFYGEDRYKNIYFKIRNSILVEQSTNWLYFLFKLIYNFFIFIPSIIMDISFMKNVIKIGNPMYRNNEVKQTILGTMHGLTHYKKYREKIEKWYNENISEKKDNNLLNHLRIPFSQFSYNNFMKKLILYYIISLESPLNYKTTDAFFLKMLKEK